MPIRAQTGVLGYDPNGNITSRRLRDGTTTLSYSYDALNRLTTKTVPEGAVTYTYDNLGHTTSIAQGTTSLSFTFDALGRNLTQVGPQGTVTSTWDLAGRRAGIAYPGGGLTVTYNYLTTGEVSSIVDGATSLASCTYDAVGNRTGVTYGNGVSQTYSYDPMSRLTTLAMAGSSNNLTMGGSTTPITYNPASEITSAYRSNSAYSFPRGQIGNVNRGYTVNSQDKFAREIRAAMREAWRTMLKEPIRKARELAQAELETELASLRSGLQRNALDTGTCDICSQEIPAAARGRIEKAVADAPSPPQSRTTLNRRDLASLREADNGGEIRQLVRQLEDAAVAEKAARDLAGDLDGMLKDADP